ncbi:MAG: 16S rRNA (adenine(1518)-N(6)/adenine(1519)-N(6))-dimethyltransferase RsmA [Dehalococcoidia bacterium]
MPENSVSLLAQTKALLKEFGLHARKGLGQHFLIDRAALSASISAAELTPADVVVEVGPGLGALTEALAGAAGRVIAIEIDPRMADLLAQRFAHLPNVTIVNADILQVDITDVLKGELPFDPPSYKVVANLPYYVATPTIRRFLEAEIKPKCMVVMIQKEVARSIVARPGDMSILSVSVQIYGNPSIVEYVPAQSFYPPPKVDSAIVRIEVYDQPVAEIDMEGFFRVVKAGFCAPRKQLRNALAKGLSILPADAAGLLEIAGISPKRRAETLSVEEWVGLYRTIVISPPFAGGEQGLS